MHVIPKRAGSATQHTSFIMYCICTENWLFLSLCDSASESVKKTNKQKKNLQCTVWVHECEDDQRVSVHVSVCVYWVHLCISVCVHTRVCRLEQSAVTSCVFVWEAKRREEGELVCMGEGEIRLCLLPAYSTARLLTRYGREIESNRKTEAGRKESGREGEQGRKREQERAGARKEKEGIRFNHFRKSDSSHNTSHGEYHIDPFTRKVTGGYMHIHAHTCTFSQTLSLTHIKTNHCYTKQGLGWTIYHHSYSTQTGSLPFSEGKQHSSHLLWFSAGLPLCPPLVPPPQTPLQPQSLGGLIDPRHYCSLEDDRARTAASCWDKTAPALSLKDKQKRNYHCQRVPSHSIKTRETL